MVKIIDVLGRQIYSNKLDKNLNIAAIILSNINSGIYQLVILHDGKRVDSLKIVLEN